MRKAELLAALRGPGTRPQVLECLQALAAPLHGDDPECVILDRAISDLEDLEDGMRAVSEMRADDLENERLRYQDRGEYDAATPRIHNFLMGAV